MCWFCQQSIIPQLQTHSPCVDVCRIEFFLSSLGYIITVPYQHTYAQTSKLQLQFLFRDSLMMAMSIDQSHNFPFRLRQEREWHAKHVLGSKVISSIVFKLNFNLLEVIITMQWLWGAGTWDDEITWLHIVVNSYHASVGPMKYNYTPHKMEVGWKCIHCIQYVLGIEL